MNRATRHPEVVALERQGRPASPIRAPYASKAERAASKLRYSWCAAELARLGDDGQLANIDLQNALQKQQQTLQTMSNMSERMHDTAKNMIQNMR